MEGAATSARRSLCAPAPPAWSPDRAASSTAGRRRSPDLASEQPRTREGDAMRAIVIHGKLDLRNDELAAPEPGEGDVLLRMAYGGICGSDLHYYNEGANGEVVGPAPLGPR